MNSLPNFSTAASYSRGNAVERIRTEGFVVDVEKVIRRLVLPSDVAPQIRIDRALDDEGAPLLEERLQLGRQQRDHPIGDELVRLESPGLRRG